MLKQICHAEKERVQALVNAFVENQGKPKDQQEVIELYPQTLVQPKAIFRDGHRLKTKEVWAFSEFYKANEKNLAELAALVVYLIDGDGNIMYKSPQWK